MAKILKFFQMIHLVKKTSYNYFKIKKLKIFLIYFY